MIYQCYRCLWTTNIKTKMTMHISRKRPCKMETNIDNIDEHKTYIFSGMSYNEYCEKILSSKFSKMSSKCNNLSSFCNQNVTKKCLNECKFCKKNLSSRQALWRHLKNCKEKQKDDTVKESMNELVDLLNKKDKELKKKDFQYQRQISEQNKQIKELIKKAGIVTTTTNNIQNNIKLLNYNDTDTSHLTENDYVKCLEHYNFCVPHLIRKIHFNPKKPENHNVYISNLKNSYVMVYTNNKWKVKNREEIISSMIDEKQIILEHKVQEWIECGNKYPKLMAKFSRYLEKREQNDVINAIKEDLKLILYNNRNMIIQNNKFLLTH